MAPRPVAPRPVQVVALQLRPVQVQAALPPVLVLRPVLTVEAVLVLHRHPVQVAPPRPVLVLHPVQVARQAADYLMATLPPVLSLVALPAPVALHSRRQLPPCPVQAAAIYREGSPTHLNQPL